MKKTIISSLLLMSAMSAGAQVSNCCLRLSQGAQVCCGMMTEMSRLADYSVQLWLCPDSWTKGATLLSVDGQICLRLDEEGTVEAQLGSSSVDIRDAALKAGKWTQLTIVVRDGRCRALVNGKSVCESDAHHALSEEIGELKLGGDFAGRLDEVRLWSTALDADRDYYVHNTLNRWVPEADKLLVYYKFDQDLCADIVDYKALFAPSAAYNHHAHMPQGASREKVDDNEALPYLLCGAYLSNRRFFDRGVKADQYLLANDIIILGIKSHTDGHLEYATPNDHATLGACKWLPEYKGRNGVVELDGKKGIVTTSNVLKPVTDSYGKAAYTFETWIYLDEWTEGAYIVRRQTDDGKHGFSISLGEEDTKQVIVTVNGKKFINTRSMPIGKWTHFAVTVYAGGTVGKTFMFAYDDKAKFAADKISDQSTDYTPIGADDCQTVIGENLHAHLDATAAWSRRFSIDELKNHMNGLPMPAVGKVQTAEVIDAGQCLYEYDREDCPGFDSYSQDHWLEMIRDVFKGYRGAQVRISVESHNGWQNTISDATRRKTFARDLARLSEPYDGVELDLEWMDGKQTNLGLLADDIRAVLPEGKTFMISCHAYGAYQFPKEKMDKVDGFTFQQYGPQKTFFSYDSFTSSARNFLNYGFPKNKTYLSFSTTTSQAYNSADQRVGAIAGYRTLMEDDSFSPNDESLEGKAPMNGNYYYYMSPDQVYDRAKYVVDNGLQGIFYWDMGNDISVAHPLSITRNASYALNSNVDPIITSVSICHPTAVGKVSATPNRISYDSTSQTASVQTITPASISLVSMTGAVLKTSASTSLSLQDVPSGCYVVRADFGEQEASMAIKVVKVGY